MKTAIDWTTRPEPWDKIGPAFREEVERIARHPPPFAHPLKVGPLPLPRGYRGKQ